MTQVLVRYTKHTDINHGDNAAMSLKVSRWLNEHVSYQVDWAYINSAKVGVYLEEEDAILFRLMMDNELLKR